MTDLSAAESILS